MTDETSGLREVVETLLALRGECQKHSGDWRGDSVTIAHLDQAILVLRARPALSDETLREMAREAATLAGYFVTTPSTTLQGQPIADDYRMIFDRTRVVLLAFARAVLARQQEQP